MFNQGDEVLPSPVINHFRSFGSSGQFLSLRCFSQEGHGDLQWLTRDVESLPDVLTAEVDSSLTALSIIGSEQGHDLTLNLANFSSSSAGYYICQSNESGNRMEVLTTTSEQATFLV